MTDDVFVGRNGVLLAIDRWLDDARAGKFRAVVLSGPAGIGKTTVVHKVLERAAAAGFSAGVGTCHEEPDAASQPLLAAIRSVVEMGDGAEAPAERDAHIAAAVISKSRTRPLLLCLDDAQWANQPTMALLTEVVSLATHQAGVGGVPFFVLVAHRPILEGGGALARLSREPAARRVQLDGLGELEVNQLLVAAAPAPPSRALLAMIERASGGNPLLVRLTLEHLIRTHRAEVRDGELQPAGHDVVATIADNLDTAVSRWVASVTDGGRDLLVAAAVVGDGGLLRDVKALAPDDFDRHLDELEGAGLLASEDGRTIAFGHPQLVATVLGSVGASARRRLHARLADAMEASREVVAPTLIADHLQRAGTEVSPARTAAWSLRAGDHALPLGAWSDAARHFDVAIDLDPATGSDVAVLLRAANAHYRNHETARSSALATQVLELVRGSDDTTAWFDALILLLQGRSVFDATAIGEGADNGPAEEFLAAASPTPAQRAAVLAAVAQRRFVAFDLEAGVVDSSAALAAAQASGDPKVMTRCLFVDGLLHLGLVELEDAERDFREVRALAQRLHDPIFEGQATSRLATICVLRGQPDAAELAATTAGELVTRHLEWGDYSVSCSCRAMVATMQGAFGTADAAAAEAEAAWMRSGYSFTPQLLFPTLAWARGARGDHRGGTAAVERWEESGARGTWRYRLLLDLLVDPTATAVDPAVLDRALIETPLSGRTTLFQLPRYAASVEAADAKGTRRGLDIPLSAFVHAWTAGVRFCIGWPISTARMIGVAHLGLEQSSEAIRWFEHAISAADAAGSKSERGRARLDLARAFMAIDEPAAALDHLRLAVADFDAVGLVPLVARTRRVAGELTADVPGEDLATRYLLMTDLVDSTGLNVRAGDRAYLELLKEHNRVIRDALRERGGVEFKHTGDGICAWFSSPAAAVEGALDIQIGLEKANLLHPDFELSVRAGIASGQPLGDEGDLFGLAVVLSGRVCEGAGAGEIHITEAVAEVVKNAGIRVRRLGARSFKGFPTSHVVFEVVRPDGPTQPWSDR